MPRPTIHDFEHEFREGKAQVEELFTLGRRACQMSAEDATEKEKAKKAGKRLPKKKAPACYRLADECRLGRATVYAARGVAAAFTDSDKEQILDALYESETVPSVEHFRLWATVPPAQRTRCVEQTIAQRLSCQDLQLAITNEFPDRGNGGSTPKPPKSQEEAVHQLGVAQRRLQSIFEKMMRLPLSTADGPIPEERSRVWNQVYENLKSMQTQIGQLYWEELSEEQKASMRQNR